MKGWCLCICRLYLCVCLGAPGYVYPQTRDSELSNFDRTQWPGSYYDCFVFRRIRVWLSYWLGFSQISISCWHVLHVFYMTSDPDIWNTTVSHCICACFLKQTLLCFRLISCLSVIVTLWTTHIYILMVPTSSTPHTPLPGGLWEGLYYNPYSLLICCLSWPKSCPIFAYC